MCDDPDDHMEMSIFLEVTIVTIRIVAAVEIESDDPMMIENLMETTFFALATIQTIGAVVAVPFLVLFVGTWRQNRNSKELNLAVTRLRRFYGNLGSSGSSQ